MAPGCHADFSFPHPSMQPRSIASHGQALVTKHNKLIQARYALSLQEKRLILWLVSAIRPGDTDFHSYRVSVRMLAELLGVEKNKNIYAVRTDPKNHGARLIPMAVQMQDGLVVALKDRQPALGILPGEPVTSSVGIGDLRRVGSSRSPKTTFTT